MQATLFLEDGTKVPGVAAGAPGVAIGDLTVYAGHDPVQRLTDPASSGQICAFTQPAVGLWGVNTEHCETGTPWVRGAVMRKLCGDPSNWRSAETLDFYLRRHLIPAIEGIDVPSLQSLAEEKKIKRCAIVNSADFNGWDALREQIRSHKADKKPFPAAVKTVSSFGSKNAVAHVAVCDFGSSRALTRLLISLRVRVTLLPPYDASVILSRGGYDGVIYPDGAGEPRSHPAITEGVRDLLDTGIPMLGFGLGFRYIGAALGARFTQMKSPHRGAWIPVTDLRTGALLYTWQMHGHTPDVIPEGLAVTHRNPLDGTIEGFAAEDGPVAAVHFLPCSDLRVGGTGELCAILFGLLKGSRHYA
ncbi:MAG: hypothetical protein LBR72_04895 [Oscillospiraceae bacterium]|jgi:carbamoyl-phosphate synthase small subunit|nr:hypothetical protein [Oscillospiraceae bacterium]